MILTTSTWPAETVTISWNGETFTAANVTIANVTYNSRRWHPPSASYEATFEMSAEARMLIERAVARLERHHAERLRKSRELMERAIRQMRAAEVSRALAVEEARACPPSWRNPGIPRPRFARIRCAAPRQSVPPRTRRRVRTWER